MGPGYHSVPLTLISRRVSGLFFRSFRLIANDNQAPGIRPVCIAVESTKQLYVSETGLLHSISQFLSGVYGVMKLEAFHSSFSDQDPFVTDSSPVIKYLSLLNELRTIRQDVRSR